MIDYSSLKTSRSIEDEISFLRAMLVRVCRQERCNWCAEDPPLKKYPSQMRFCSPECRKAYYAARESPPSTGPCECCGEPFERKKSMGRYADYCSNACRQKAY